MSTRPAVAPGAAARAQALKALGDLPIPGLSLTLKEVNWVHAVLLSVTPMIALYGILNVPLQFKTFVFAFIWYFYTGFGITVGYHRYWSHRSYDASKIFQLIMALGGAGAVQGSIRWWSRGHRAHHRYTDTSKDPYNARKGPFWSHLGWLLVKTDYSTVGRVDISDLNRDPIVLWQNRNYPLIAVMMSVVVMVHHATFCVNSLAHLLGDATFDDRHTPRDNYITALITFGEGYHNFHHEFPNDYRNALGLFQYDPSKWVIFLASLIGLTSNLKEFHHNEIEKGRITMAQKFIDERRKTLKFGPKDADLPRLTFADFQKQCRDEGRMLMIIDRQVYDVADFLDQHPGGRGFLKTSIGKDVTAAFNGGIYDHHNAARNLASMMRVAIIDGDIPSGHVSKEE
ncbi:hypothetical protein BC831DRAFT_479353 [Entophlyctis helioformis]|nr:hypothetical protein BC831DRAFT_479353 [Entophlyctis helioformis]